MNKIDSIIIHCSATKAGIDLKAKDIDRMHRQRGFRQIGYHYIICLDGTIEKGRPLKQCGAHCNTNGLSDSSYNKHSIGICYIGGLDINGKPADTRTEAQKKALHNLVDSLCDKYTILEIIGHRDASPDADNDGEVEPHEWIKHCPCFDVASEFPNYLPQIIIT